MKTQQLIFILLIFSGCIQNSGEKDRYIKVIDIYDNGVSKYEYIYPNRNDTLRFKYVSYYKNGIISFEGDLENWYYKGIKKSYFENGNPKEFCYLSDSGKFSYCCPDGYYEMYFENGNLQETHYRINDQISGLVTLYDTQGIKTEEINVISGLRNGITKEFYSDGSLFSKTIYKNDTLIDIGVEFYKSGDTMIIYNTYKGKVDFPVMYWKKDGSKLVGEYYAGKNDKVKWTWRDSLGIQIKEEIVGPIDG